MYSKASSLATACRVLRLIADPNRARILRLLRGRSHCVCELTYILDITQPSVSRHLKKLSRAGLIRAEQDGFWTNYVLTNDSPLARSVLRELNRACGEDTLLLRDRAKAARIDRKNICCPPNTNRPRIKRSKDPSQKILEMDKSHE